jgi:ribosomal protein S18 acetylase RimI-like enzyme
MAVTIRPAVRADWAAIEEIVREVDALHRAGEPEVIGPSPEPARPTSYVEDPPSDPDSALLVAERGGQVVGLVRVVIRERPPMFIARRVAVVEELVVLERVRGQGIGRQLMKAAEELARQRGATEVWLDVWSFNDEAFGFYEHLGYREVIRRLRLPLEDGTAEFQGG